jgi:hypothetical protein
MRCLRALLSYMSMVHSNHGAFHAQFGSVDDALTNGHRRVQTLMGW